MSIDMDKKIYIKNLCNYPLYFPRINGSGDVSLPALTTIRIDTSEVVSQSQNNNTMFNGTDGKGSHAMIFIDDKDVRVYLDFETEEKPQDIITDEKIKEAFGLKAKTKFESAIKELATTYAEKVSLVSGIKRLGFNEYDKIKFVEKYTGMKVE